MDETDALTRAVAAWVRAVLPRLDPDQRRVFEAMLEGRCDVAVEARLRKGTITLLATDEVQGTFTVLYREDVEPLRPITGFGSPDTSRNQ